METLFDILLVGVLLSVCMLPKFLLPHLLCYAKCIMIGKNIWTNYDRRFNNHSNDAIIGIDYSTITHIEYNHFYI